MTYTEKSHSVILESSIAVQVLLGTAPGDCEMVPLRPKMADDMWLADLKTRWPGRGLRVVGVIGLCGASPLVAFKEPLEPEQVSALAAAFLTYVHVMFADSFAAQFAERQIGDEVAWLEMLHALPDTRPN